MSYQYKGVTIDSNFCTTGTLDVASCFDGFPLAPTTYLNTTADTINTDFGYGETFTFQGKVILIGASNYKSIVITDGTTPTLYQHTISGTGITTPQQITTFSTFTAMATFASTTTVTLSGTIPNLSKGDFVYGDYSGLPKGSYVTNTGGGGATITMDVSTTKTQSTPIQITFCRASGNSDFSSAVVGPITMTAALTDFSRVFNAYTDELEASLQYSMFNTGEQVTYSYCTNASGTYSIPSYFNNMKVLLYGDGGGGGGGRDSNNTGNGGGAGATIIADISLNTDVSNRINYFNYSIGGGGKGGLSNNTTSGDIGNGTNITLSDSFTNTILEAGGGKGGKNSKVPGIGGTYSATISPNMKIKVSGANGGNGASDANNQYGGAGGAGSNSVTAYTSPGVSFTYTLSGNRQKIVGGTSVANNFSGCPGTDDTYYTYGDGNSLFKNTVQIANSWAIYYFYDKNVSVPTANTTRIGYAGGGGGGGAANGGHNTVGGPGAPGFIKIWLYA